jgi:hypothetical protein
VAGQVSLADCQRGSSVGPETVERSAAAGEALARGFIEKDAGGDGCVEAFNGAGAGDGEDAVGFGGESGGHANALIADEQGDGAGEINEVGRLALMDGGGPDFDAGLAEGGDGVVLRMGRRKRLPAEARTALGFHALTVPGSERMPSAPKASAERRMVPRLPGSCSPARTTMSGASFCVPRRWARVQSGGSTRAAMGCGVSVARVEARSSGGTRRISVAEGRWMESSSRCESCATKTQGIRIPARRASSSRWNPSIPASP